MKNASTEANLILKRLQRITGTFYKVYGYYC